MKRSRRGPLATRCRRLPGRGAAAAQPPPPNRRRPTTMPETVVTATGRPEEVSRIAGTIQIIPQERIAHSIAKSVTDLLAENAVGFMSEWTAAQTSINIRGACDRGPGPRLQEPGAGADQRPSRRHGQRLQAVDRRRRAHRDRARPVLGDLRQPEHGRRDQHHPEDRPDRAGHADRGGAGSWSLFQGKAQSGGTTGKYDWYVGVEGGSRSDYNQRAATSPSRTPTGRATAAPAPSACRSTRTSASTSRSAATASTTRASAARPPTSSPSTTATTSRPTSPTTARRRTAAAACSFQAYYVRDVDDLNNPSPLSALNALRRPQLRSTATAASSTSWARASSRATSRGRATSCCSASTGSAARSARTAIALTNAVANQLSPQDNNQTENVFAFYVEDAQRFFDDRMTVRGGVRQTYGNTAVDWTPNAPTLLPGSNNYQATTYSVGATFAATNWLNTRVGASSGFRAPTATELGANFTVTPIGTTIFGNPNLQPENANQIEAGATANWDGGPPRPGDLPEHHQQPHHGRHHLVGRRRGHPAAAEQSRRHRRAGPRVPARSQRDPHARAEGAGDLELERVRQRLLQFQDDRLRCAARLRHRHRDAHQPVRGRRSARASARPASRCRGTSSCSASCADRCGTTPRNR